ncbi:MAG: hypothetical protein ACR2MX_10445, partial [Cyclobacteriaceae bacterium]
MHINIFSRYLDRKLGHMYYYLALAILCNVGLFLSFRSFSHFRMNTFQAIVVNYLVCVFTGLIFLGGFNQVLQANYQTNWVTLAIVLGATFIGSFYLMGKVTQGLGVVVATVASKMSMVIPVLVSLFFLKIASKAFDLWNYMGICMALIAILLSSLKGPVEISRTGKKIRYLMLPLLLFLVGGSIDALINFANYEYLTQSEAAIFPLLIFASAALMGLIILAIGKPKIQLKNIVGGIYLGVPNFFSLY